MTDPHVPLSARPSARRWPRPWRSARLGWGVAAAALVAGVPVFVRMPPWCDVTLYDVAARNVLSGGVLYRDVFDTNLPGFVWGLAAVRAALGWGYEVLWAVDLLVVAGAVALIDRLAKRAGASPAAWAWAVAGAAAFYPFTCEVNHGQRDVWMMLPALAAVALRARRLCADDAPRPTFFPALLEGARWGLAVWIKPHVAVPAAAVWVLTAARSSRLLTDLAGNLAGAILVGAAGVAYLVGSGAWPHFEEVFTFWNPGYAALMAAELPIRFRTQLHYFPPWSYLQVIAVPVAVMCVLDARPWARAPAGVGPVGRVLPLWLWDRGTDDRVRFARLVLAAVYLGWTAQGLFLQRGFFYVHVPEVLLLLGVLATQRWAAGCLVIAWLTLSSLAVSLGGAEAAGTPLVLPSDGPPAVMFRHPVADPGRFDLWLDCWRTGLDDRAYHRRMNAAGQVHDFHGANDWEQLGEVADELRRLGATDGDVIAWHDGPHAVYLLLGVRPGFRFQHVNQMTRIGPAQQWRVGVELAAAAARAKWVVSDLKRISTEWPELLPDPAGCGPDLLPPTLHPRTRDLFPYDQPAVFRSGGGHGRYVIHELRNPVTWPAYSDHPEWEPGDR